MKGFKPLMPTFQGLISEEGLVALIEYIKSLSPTQATDDRARPPVHPPRRHQARQGKDMATPVSRRTTT